MRCFYAFLSSGQVALRSLKSRTLILALRLGGQLKRTSNCQRRIQEQVALVDVDAGDKRTWSLLPEACPEVVAALRAAAVPMSLGEEKALRCRGLVASSP